MRRRRRRRLPVDGVWRQAGGGCLLVGNNKYPCDVEYVRRRVADVEERLEVVATVAAYVGLPSRARYAAEIYSRPGVKLLSRSRHRVYYTRRLRYGKATKGRA